MPATGQPTPAATAASKGGRRLWFDLHSWVGLKLSVLMAFVSLTGTLAVFSYEIDWALHPQMRVTPGEQRVGLGTMVAAARAQYPGWELRDISVPRGPRSAAMLRATTPEGRLRFVWVDPYRGEVTGDSAWFNVQRFLRNTHRHLMMPTRIGVPIVSALALALLVTLASSFVIYKKWWRGFLSWPRPERQRRLWGDLHRLMGVWSLWFIALIAATGLWYLAESLGGKAGPHPPVRQPVTGAAGTPAAAAPSAAAIDRALARARQAWPELEVARVSWDERGLLIEGQAAAWLVRDRANALGFDATGQTLTGRRDGRDLGVHHRVSEMADPLHFGTFGGLFTKVPWFLFGLLMTALSVTGVYLYGLRVADALRAQARRNARTGART